MTSFVLDWAALFRDPPLGWLIAGVITTLAVTVVGSLIAGLLTLLITALRLTHGPSRWLAVAYVEIFRNTPLLVQLFFWYFAAFAALPYGWRRWINQDHIWATLPHGVALITPEFIVSALGLGAFAAAFMVEELRAGLAAVPAGQIEAARAQGFSPSQLFQSIIIPQGLTNAWQPLIGQYLNLMKLSSLASAVGLAEITYAARQIESYNAHAIEGFAAGTLLYLVIGVVLARLMTTIGPKRPGSIRRSPVEIRQAAAEGNAA